MWRYHGNCHFFHEIWMNSIRRMTCSHENGALLFPVNSHHVAPSCPIYLSGIAMCGCSPNDGITSGVVRSVKKKTWNFHNLGDLPETMAKHAHYIPILQTPPSTIALNSHISDGQISQIPHLHSSPWVSLGFRTLSDWRGTDSREAKMARRKVEQNWLVLFQLGSVGGNGMILNLVGGLNPSEKYERQLGGWHSQYMGK